MIDRRTFSTMLIAGATAASLSGHSSPAQAESMASARNMHAKTIEVDASHLSLVTHPQEIADLILDATGRLS